MKIQFDINKIDILKFNLYSLPRNRHVYQLFAGILLMFFIFDRLLRKPFTLESFMETAFSAAISTGVLSLLSLIMPFFISSTKNNVIGSRIMQFTDDGFMINTEQSDGFQNWTEIDSIVKTHSNLLLKKGIVYHIIPKRTFKNSQAYEHFAHTVKNHWQKGRSGENTQNTDKGRIKAPLLGKPLMAVTTTVNKRDIITYIWHTLTRTKSLYLMSLLVTFFMEIIVPHTSQAGAHSILALVLTEIIMAIIIYLIAFSMILFFSMLFMSFNAVTNKGIYNEGEVHYLLFKESLYGKSAQNEGSVEWSMVDTVTVFRPCVILISGFTAQLFPRRCFANEAEFTKFSKLAQKYWKEARN